MSATIKYGPHPVHRLLRERNISMAEIIRESGMREGHVYQSIRGVVAPNAEIQAYLVKKLGLPVEELFADNGLNPVRKPNERQITGRKTQSRVDTLERKVAHLTEKLEALEELVMKVEKG